MDVNKYSLKELQVLLDDTMEIKSELPKIVTLNEEKTKELQKYFKSEIGGWVLVGNKKWFLRKKFMNQCPLYYNFEIRSEDKWIVSFPRSGTTWTQEMMWLLCNDLDYPTAKTTPLLKRFPFLDTAMLVSDVVENNPNNTDMKPLLSEREFSYKIIDSMSSPRFVKTHFALSLMPNILKSGCKTIYIARNPKDVAISYYYFMKNLKSSNYEGSFEMFWHYFETDCTLWGPYWEHLKEGWAQRNNPNFLFLFYEEMNHDLLSVVKRVAKFLDKTHTEAQYQELVEHLRFSNMKENTMVNLTRGHAKGLFKEDIFMREGKSQAWHDMFSPELNAKANCWIEENLKDTDLQFPFIEIYS